MKPVMLVLPLLLLALPARADQRVTIGGGAESCASWTKSYGKNRADIERMMQWVFGFASAQNLDPANPEFLAQADPIGMEGFINQFCARHPLDPISEASVWLIRTLKARAHNPTNP